MSTDHGVDGFCPNHAATTSHFTVAKDGDVTQNLPIKPDPVMCEEPTWAGDPCRNRAKFQFINALGIGGEKVCRMHLYACGPGMPYRTLG